MTTPTAARTSLVPLLALGSGVAVAANYYLQPLLALIARDLGVGVGAMGVVSSLALLGYALGCCSATSSTGGRSSPASSASRPPACWRSPSRRRWRCWASQRSAWG